MEQKVQEKAAELQQRVMKLRAVLAEQEQTERSSDWGNFGNEWGQGGGFDNKTRFENGY